jgi:hypothetical protein
MPERVGFIGLGYLCAHLATSLVRASHHVFIHDLHRGGAESLLASGRDLRLVTGRSGRPILSRRGRRSRQLATVQATAFLHETESQGSPDTLQ